LVCNLDHARAMVASGYDISAIFQRWQRIGNRDTAFANS